MKTLFYAIVLLFPLLAEDWRVRIEEPTGIYARDNEVVAVPLAKIGSHASGYSVRDAQGKDVVSQVTATELLFPVSLVPGELPVYTISCCASKTAESSSRLVARNLGTTRMELANARFRVILDTRTGAIIEAYSLSAGPARTLNFVETTPDRYDPNDIHADRAKPLEPAEPNPGWTTLGGTGGFTQVDIAESGPLRARILLTRAAERWEFLFTEHSAWLRWRAGKGYRFSCVSAAPYMPFDRFGDGDESRWPTGPSSDEPPEHDIFARTWTKPPGGHMVYYRGAENYGALGLVALDAGLDWSNAGTRRVTASKNAGETEIALTFPLWAGNSTVLEARKEARCLRQPLLVSLLPAHAGALVQPRPQVSGTAGGQTAKVELNGDWSLAWGEKGAGPASERRTVKVPGSAHVQWLPADQIYTRQANWVSGKEWWYTRSFTVPAGWAGKRIRLQFDATDYYADTYIDGRHVGRHEGYIDPYEYEVTEFIKPGQHQEISVRVWTPVDYYWRHRPYTIKGAYGAVDQKPDDITALGITRGVRLVASGLAWIEDIAVSTRLTGEGAAVELQLSSNASDPHWEAALEPRNFQGTERPRAQGRGPLLVIPVRDPQLWWTWDQGKPNLYTLTVRLLSGTGDELDRKQLAVGIREIERIADQFYLNRRRVFLRGTNSYYHLFLSEMNRAAYERDLALILRMNVNIIRLHCHFTNPEFYQLADERGVMIWQDFLEAWYPHDTRFSTRAASLYDNHIRYVRNHPAVAVWAPCDEEDLENYRDLSKHLAGRLAQLDPQHRPVVRSTGRWQDAHLYHGWYGDSIWKYTSMTENLVTELGATTLPARESLDKFLPGKWPITAHADEWRFHKLQIEEALANWGDPKGMTLDEYIPRTQAYGARLFQLALERSRRRKAEGAGGIFHFFAIDIWPSVTMAAYDFYRVPTKVVDTVRRSFEPVLASIVYTRDTYKEGEEVRFPLWAVNDRSEAVTGRIEWEGGVQAIQLPPDSSQLVGEVKWKAAGKGPAKLALRVTGAGGRILSENLYEFRVTR